MVNPAPAPKIPPPEPPVAPPPPGGDDDGDDAADPTVEDMVCEILDVESQRRKWLKAIQGFLAQRSRETDPSPRVQLASDLAAIAGFERIGRLLRSDLPEGPM